MALPKEAYGPGTGTIPDEGLRVDIDEGPRCWRCNHKLAYFVSRPWALLCRKCKSVNMSPGAQPILARMRETDKSIPEVQ